MCRTRSYPWPAPAVDSRAAHPTGAWTAALRRFLGYPQPPLQNSPDALCVHSPAGCTHAGCPTIFFNFMGTESGDRRAGTPLRALSTIASLSVDSPKRGPQRRRPLWGRSPGGQGGSPPAEEPPQRRAGRPLRGALFAPLWGAYVSLFSSMMRNASFSAELVFVGLPTTHQKMTCRFLGSVHTTQDSVICDANY